MISDAEKSHLHTGYKQALKALSENRASKLYIASDAEDKIREPLERKALELGIETVAVPTMKELGTLCGIEVGSSCAVVLKI